MHYLLRRNIFLSLVTLFAADVSAVVDNSMSFITQLKDIELNQNNNANNDEYIGVVTLSQTVPCSNKENELGYFSPEVNQLTNQGLIDKLIALNQNNNNTYYRITLENCDLTKLKFENVQVCNSEICPEKYVLGDKIWLNNDYKKTELIETAGYFIQLPLTKDEEKNLWIVKGWFAEDIFDKPISETSPTLAFEGYTDNNEFAEAKFVGPFTRYYYNGNIAKTSQYNAQGLLDGHSLTYYSSGKLHQDAFVINGKLEGLIITLHENGKEESRVTYRDSKVIDGLCLHYFDNGTISRKHQYLNGKYDGELLEYDHDGRVTERSIYNNGVAVESTYNRYTGEGKLKQHDIYINGVQRVYQTWQNNGTPHVDWQWNEKHKEIGEQKTWYSNGQIEEIKLYDNNGVLIQQTTWGEDGNKWYEDYFYPNKKLKESKRWDDTGQLTNHNYYDQNGNKVSHKK